MKKIIFLLMCLPCAVQLFAQLDPSGKVYDETQLTMATGTSAVSDATALGGYAIHPTGSINQTAWYGPQVSVQAGNYLVQFRVKVASNSSTSNICTFDVWSNTTSTQYASIQVKPSMFRNSGEWQLFTIPVQLPANLTDVQFRGMSYTTGITDLYFDYVNLIPGDMRGYYSPEFSISPKGSVGIGTTSINDANYKLFVEGAVRARKVKVDQSSWADYVFDSTYQLPDLMQVETYIKANKHLPDVPSAAAIEKDGLNLGDGQALLLKKIEELTLYLIELKKENAAIRRELEKLKN